MLTGGQGGTRRCKSTLFLSGHGPIFKRADKWTAPFMTEAGFALFAPTTRSTALPRKREKRSEISDGVTLCKKHLAIQYSEVFKFNPEYR